MMRKKILTLALFVGAMLLLTATGVLAASPVVSNPHPTLQDPILTPTITATLTMTHPVAAIIADFFGLDYTQVQGWHDQGIGYGNMAIALFFVDATGLSFEDIMALRGQEEGGGWGVIMRPYGLHPGNQMNLGAIRSGRVVTETEPMTGTVGTTARPDRGPKETPPGWERGKGHGLGRGQNRGHGRGHNK